jgi:hypothetical protein
MSPDPLAEEPMEILLADGGRVVVAFADAGSRLLASDQLIETILHADGSEHDVERAIQDDVRALGLPCRCSTGRSPTVIVIG